MKKTICLVTNWYPTKENPFQGLFFKEQAFAVSENFNFVVIHYREHMGEKIVNRVKVSPPYTEKNTIEYFFDVSVPLSVYMADVIHDFKIKHIRKKYVDGIGKYISEKRKTYTQKTITKLVNQYVKESVDVFYCVDAQQEAFIIQCLAQHFNKPYIVGEHAPVPWPGTVMKDINKYAIENANMFLAISNDKIRQLLLQNIRLPKIKYIGNLIDETKLLPKKNGNDIKTFVIVAAHSFYKNYALFIAIMNKLVEITKCDFRVMIVGYGSNKGYSKNIEDFENEIRNSKFADKAIMIPEVPHEKIGETLNKADAFIMTSIQEGQPVSAMEAACCGLPIFSTRCGGVEDYVDEKMGRIYSILDSDGMAQGLKDFLEGKMEFDSEYIRKQVVKRFGTKAFVENFTSAFVEVCGKKIGNKAFTNKYIDRFNRVIDDAGA